MNFGCGDGATSSAAISEKQACENNYACTGAGQEYWKI
jgi:hypothetical protein